MTDVPLRNAPWSIAFGDYELLVDRRTLTFRLTETRTGTVWAEAASLGWIEIRNRADGSLRRIDFGAVRQVSVSEKAGPQGKRILFGLDCEGIPIDIYLICSVREIQIQIESNRDSRTHQVERFGLIPGLCAVPNERASYLVLPSGEGALVFANDAPSDPVRLPIWESDIGVTMPFVGAVRGRSALAVLTDSAYGTFVLAGERDVLTVTPEYERDPERRRLDLRIVPLPDGDYITVAKTYREKIIGENAHITLRKKMREKAALPALTESDAACATVRTASLTVSDEQITRWDVLDRTLAQIADLSAQGTPVRGEGGSDWANIGVDAVRLSPSRFSPRVPLYAVVYRDCVFLDDGRDENRAVPFSAFVTGHRFVNDDFTVEETVFSDKTRIVANARN